MRFRKSYLLAGGSALSLLTLASIGYSSWLSSTSVEQGISSQSSIPPPSNLVVSTSGSTYNLTWTAPTGTDYNGNSLAQSFEIQKSSTGLAGSWSTLAVVPGTTTSYSTPASATSVAYFRVVTDDNGWLSTYDNSSVAQPASSLIKTSTFNYTGGLQYISAPAGTQYISVIASGAGGGGGNNLTTYGGNGDLISAHVPIAGGQSLVVLVGGGGVGAGTDSGSGGGLTGVFNGAPSQSTALLIAGGGGGGANDYSAGSQQNGTNGSLTPSPSIFGGDGLSGGPGYGGAGGAGDYPAGNDGTPFGAGGANAPGFYNTVGGYGGGASGGQGWGGGGGGSGYVGGQGGNGGEYVGSGGEGGTSYAIPTASSVTDHPGLGGAGGYGTNGTDGSVTIAFYS